MLTYFAFEYCSFQKPKPRIHRPKRNILNTTQTEMMRFTIEGNHVTVLLFTAFSLLSTSTTNTFITTYHYQQNTSNNVQSDKFSDFWRYIRQLHPSAYMCGNTKRTVQQILLIHQYTDSDYPNIRRDCTPAYE